MGRRELREVLAAAVDAGDLNGGLRLIAQVDPLTRFGVGRRLASAYGAASARTASNDERHVLRLAYLDMVGDAPDDPDDLALVEERYRAHRGAVPVRVPPWRTTQVTAALALLLAGGAVAAWFLVPRAYDDLSLLGPVVADAYASGGRPSAGSDAQREVFERALPELMIALDRDAGEAGPTLRSLVDQAHEAALPEGVQRALEAYAAACVRARIEGGQEAGTALLGAGADLNAALAAAELGYYVDTQVRMDRSGNVRVFFETFVVLHVAPYQLDEHAERALHIRRLDHTNIALQTLGFTRAEANEALVQVDTIEEHLVAHVLPALEPGSPFRLAEPHVRRSQALTQLEATAGEAVRAELMAVLQSEPAITLGRTLSARRALFERWEALAASRDAIFRAPTTYRVAMETLEPHRLYLDGFGELREHDAALGEGEVVRAYLGARDALAAVVERHELQHRYDYRAGVFDRAPPGLTGTLLRMEPGEALEERSRIVVAELSAYSASIAESETLAHTELLLLGRHVLGLGGARRNEADAAGFLLEELYAALFPEEPVVGRAPVHHAARLERLLRTPSTQLRTTLRGLWERWFGRTLPHARPVHTP